MHSIDVPPPGTDEPEETPAHIRRVRAIAWSVSLAAVAAFCGLLVVGTATGHALLPGATWMGVVAGGGVAAAVAAVLVMEVVWRCIGGARTKRDGESPPDRS